MPTEKQIHTIVEASMNKFGQPYGYSIKGDSLRICIERREPVFKDFPFMTITGRVYGITGSGDYAIDFYDGHYDLDEKTALQDITNIFQDAY